MKNIYRQKSTALPYNLTWGLRPLVKNLSDRHGSYLVKKLSDRLNSRCSLVAYLSPVVCLKPPRRYPETDRPASEASGCRKAPLWG